MQGTLLSIKYSLYNMISHNLERTLRYALVISSQYGEEKASIEHLLLALLYNQDVKELLLKENIEIQKIEIQLRDYCGSNINTDRQFNNIHVVQPSSNFQNIINRAILNNSNTNHKPISGLDILNELLLSQHSFCLTLLKQSGLTRDIVTAYIKKNPSVEQGTKPLFNYAYQNQQNDIKADSKTDNNKSANDKKSIIQLYCTNLNDRAINHLEGRLIGRHKEIERTIEVLSRKNKNNVILVGDPGVGKTAIAEGLAYRITRNEVPSILQNTTIYSLDICSLVSGTRYRGDFEERIKRLLSEIKNRSDIIIFIDEIHTIVGAGATPNSILDTSNLLKPALARGEIKCIGSTTLKEFHNHFEKDMSLVRRFQKIFVQEPSERDAIGIVRGVSEIYAKHHKVKYTDDALIAAVNLSHRYIKHRKLPDKAIDLIDEAGAKQKIDGNKDKVVSEKEIINITSQMSQIPIEMIQNTESQQLKLLSKNLKQQIFGQDNAIDRLCDIIKLSRAGLRNKSKPIGCYLFAGSSGVGKTELATQLAKFCTMNLIRLDMSEYSESHAIAKLIGSPPGYIGFNEGGILTEQIDNAPHSVILFDEVEKGNKEMFNLLLQMMDYGVVTDNAGKNVNCCNTIIILTTNLGSRYFNKNQTGFVESVSHQSHAILKEVKRHFSQEFVNRLDNIMVFNPLNTVIIKNIINKSIDELKNTLIAKSIILKINSATINHLVEICAKSQDGARSIQKTIEVNLRQPLAEEILFGKLKKGGSILVKCVDKKIIFDCIKVNKPVESDVELKF